MCEHREWAGGGRKRAAGGRSWGKTTVGLGDGARILRMGGRVMVHENHDIGGQMTLQNGAYLYSSLATLLLIIMPETRSCKGLLGRQLDQGPDPSHPSAGPVRGVSCR